ncbi:sterol desaturase family protein [Endozoicomonas numazuensis]|uniref:sterol desaturase family protein n=1 Tax=Endozoicomonas numazuensis TaxID=1137799 RepID=UPI00068B1722|nr:sterol desaturase family protein [Endozoicomonas numazuensis]
MDFSVIEWAEYSEYIVSIFILIASALLMTYELAWKLAKRCLETRELSDILSSIVSFFAYLGAGVLYFGFILTGFYAASEYALFQFEPSLLSFAACFLLADFAYYWHHRAAHRVNFLWATHSVHHSSPYMNIAVAYRFGPLDGLVSAAFHLPLVLLGFHPAIVLVCENLHQFYQTLLHTERCPKLGPIEKVFNTPSHHRVHHGSDWKYLDKNYGSVLIIWDKMFGSFREEDTRPNYGLTIPVNTSNPISVFFHGYYRMAKDLTQARNFSDIYGIIFKSPTWRYYRFQKPQEEQTAKSQATQKSIKEAV